MSEKTKDLLINRSKQIAAGAELIAAETNDWMMVQAYMTRRFADQELTTVQQDKLDRYQFIYNQLSCGKYTEQEVCEMVQSIYKRKYGQALQDVRDTKELFASSVNINKLFELKTQLALNRQMMQQAIAANDFRAAANYDKNAGKLISMLPEAEDTAADDFKPHINVFTFDPSLLGLDPVSQEDIDDLVKDIQAQYPGKLDLSFAKKKAEDIDFIEIKDGEA